MTGHRNTGSISNLISKKKAAPKRSPSRIEVLEGRVATLESTLKIVLGELTALREEVQRLSESKAEPPAKPIPKATATPKPTAKPQSGGQPLQPWDDPETLEEIETCRIRVLELFDEQPEFSKQACVDALDIPSKLASWTLAFMAQVTKEVAMYSREPTPTDPTPKKGYRLKT
ncbi:MAG: hypothetical protein OXN25_19410 [Candidatus Poribacteria bacterium]|nr:hypothetical protein [Candidatus Poribacteria bacterium]